MSKPKENEPSDAKPLFCGIVRPISPAEDCTEAHWAEVHGIIEEALTGSGFKARLVSSADESGVIQARIVQNLADDPIVICDVSTRNPNVMLELGMRLAFDLPTIVIKDDKTTYTFDAGPIEHLPYPRDLRYYRINEFKSELAKKVKATYEASQQPEYTTFLKHFKRFKSKMTLSTEEVAVPQVVLDELSAIRSEIASIPREQYVDLRRSAKPVFKVVGSVDEINNFLDKVISSPEFNDLDIKRVSDTEAAINPRVMTTKEHMRMDALAKAHNMRLMVRRDVLTD